MAIEEKILIDLQLRSQKFVKEQQRVAVEIAKAEKQLKALNKQARASATVDKDLVIQKANLKNRLSLLRKEYRDITGTINASNKAVRSQKNSYEQLSAAYRALIPQLNKLSREEKETTEEGRRLTAQLGRIRKAMIEAKQATNDGRLNVGRYRESLGRLDKGFAAVGKSIKSFVVGSIAAGGLISVIQSTRREIEKTIKAAKEYESSFADLVAITGVAGEQLEFLDEQSKNATISIRNADGAIQSISVGAAEAAQAFKVVGSQAPILLGSSEALVEVTKQAILLDKASKDLEFEQAVTGLTTSINQFVGPGAEFAEVVEFGNRAIRVLAENSLATSTGVDKAAEGLQRFGAIAKLNNTTLEESVAALSIVDQQQQQVEKSGTDLRQVISKLALAGGELSPNYIDATGSAQGLTGAIENLRKQFLAIEDPQERNIFLNDLFGDRQQAAGAILIDQADRLNSLTKRYEDQNELLQENATVTKQAFENADTLANAQNNLNNAIETIRIELGERFLPALAGIAQELAEVLRGTNEVTTGYEDSFAILRELIELYQGYRDLTQDVTSALQPLSDAIGTVNAGLSILGGNTEKAAEDIDQVNKKATIMTRIFDGAKFVINNLVTSIGPLRKVLRAVADLFGETGEAAAGSPIFDFEQRTVPGQAQANGVRGPEVVVNDTSAQGEAAQGGGAAQRQSQIGEVQGFEARIMQIRIDAAEMTKVAVVNAEAAMTKAKERATMQRIELAKLEQQAEIQTLSVFSSTAGQLSQLAREGGFANKLLASSQTVVNTYLAATKALAFGPGPPLTLPLVATTVASGLANLAKINGVKFAEGGYTGPGVGPPDSTGHKPAGIVHAGEYVISAANLARPEVFNMAKYIDSLPKFADGGFTGPSIPTRAGDEATRSMNLQDNVISFIDQMPTPFLRVSDVNKLNNRINVTDRAGKL